MSDEMTAREFIQQLAELAEDIGWQAGIGASETAGQIVSYLAANPDDFAKVMAGGIFDLPDDWWRRGRLTWMGANGKIIRPEQARRAAVIKRMERGEPA